MANTSLAQETNDAHTSIADTIKKVNNSAAIAQNFHNAIEKLKKNSGNPTAINSIGAQNYSMILSQLSSFFSTMSAQKNMEPDKEDQLFFNCELLIATPNNELTEEQLLRKKICEDLEHFVSEEIRTGTVNNAVVVANTGQTGVGINEPSGLSVTLELLANNNSDVGLQTTFSSNNFTHVSDEDTIDWYSNAISNTIFLSFTKAGHVSGMQLAEEFIAASTLSGGDLCYLDGSGEMDLADADAETTADTLLAVATEGINAASSGAFLLLGKHVTTGLTTGSVYYVSTTAGDWTSTNPSVSGDIVRIVGYALSTTTLLFKPDGTYVEIA